MVNDITYERLADLAVPALLLGAGADLIIPGPVTREIAERIPGSRYELPSDSGHTPVMGGAGSLQRGRAAFPRRDR